MVWLRRNRRFRRWTEKKVVLYERRLLLVAFQIRTLLERPTKVGHRARHSRVEGRSYKRLGAHPVTHMNVMDVNENFDLDHPQIVRLPIFDLCNQLIHHYLLAVLREEGKQRWDSVWVCSDWKRNTCLYEFSVDKVLEVFALLASEASAGYNDGSTTIRWNEKKQDYVFSTSPSPRSSW